MRAAAFWFLGPFAGPWRQRQLLPWASTLMRGGRCPPLPSSHGWALRPAPRLTTYDARGYAPLHSPRGGRSAPPTPGDFPVAGKVTKGAPRAVPFGIP